MRYSRRTHTSFHSFNQLLVSLGPGRRNSPCDIVLMSEKRGFQLSLLDRLEWELVNNIEFSGRECGYHCPSPSSTTWAIFLIQGSNRNFGGRAFRTSRSLLLPRPLLSQSGHCSEPSLVRAASSLYHFIKQQIPETAIPALRQFDGNHRERWWKSINLKMPQTSGNFWKPDHLVTCLVSLSLNLVGVAVLLFEQTETQ